MADSKKYIITEEQRNALLQYLVSRPLGEVFEGYNMLVSLQPVQGDAEKSQPKESVSKK